MKPIKTSFTISGCWDSRQGGRSENQDSCGFLDTNKGLVLVVCDGMGGGPAGRLASETAVQKIVEYVVGAPQTMSGTEIVKNAIEYAHQSIIAIGNSNPALRGMGSTATVVLINQQSAILGHVGDSRIYQLRRGRKIFRTEDHSLVAEFVRNKTLTEEQARLSSQSNIITKALGGGMSDLADVTERPYEAGDRFMLCTDGIWGMIPEKNLIQRIGKTPSISGAVDSVVLEVEEKGKAQGGTHDNLTIVVFETKKDSKIKEKMSKVTLRILGGLILLLTVSLVANIMLAGKLMMPDSDKEEVKRLNEVVAQKDSVIEGLKGDILALKNEMADVKKQTADKQLQAAEKAQKEAEEAKKEADEAKKQADEAIAKAETSDIQKKRDAAVNTMERIKKMSKKEGVKRENLRKRLIEDIKELSVIDMKNAEKYAKIREKLGNQVAKEFGDKSIGHYNFLIKEMKNIK